MVLVLVAVVVVLVALAATAIAQLTLVVLVVRRIPTLTQVVPFRILAAVVVAVRQQAEQVARTLATVVLGLSALAQPLIVAAVAAAAVALLEHQATAVQVVS
jgi:hypothetical protein